MKKKKVDALIKRFSDEARAAGERSGASLERSRWLKLLPVRGQQVTWLEGKPPQALRQVLVFDPSSTPVIAPEDPVYDRGLLHHQTIEFDAVPMALTLATGQQVRWFHWKPRRFQAHELQVMP